jgi:translocation and assembly module TamB
VSRRARWAWSLGGTAMAVGLGVLAAGSAPVLAWLLARQGIHTEGLSGSLWTGLQAQSVALSDPSLTLQARGLQLAPLRWQDGGWHTAVLAQALSLQTQPSPTPAPSPEALVARLRSPWGLTLERVQIQTLTVQGHPMSGLDARLSLGGSDEVLGLRLHQLRLPELGWQCQGELALRGPDRLRVHAQAQTPHGALQLQGDGPLARWPVQAQLIAGPQTPVTLRAELAPLAAQPVHRLQATLQGVDLRQLHPQAPQTALTGDLRLEPAAQEPAMVLQAEVSNAAARRLDQSGWPVRQLSLSAHVVPGRWNETQLDALDLRLLGSTGRITLTQPFAWPQGDAEARAAIRLDAIALRELDATWPAWRVSGPLRLARSPANGRLDLDGTVDAAPTQPGALPWRLVAQAQLSSPPEGPLLVVPQATLSQGRNDGQLQLRGRWQAQPQGWQVDIEAQAQALRLPIPDAPWPLRGTGQLQASLTQHAAHLGGRVALRLDEGSSLGDLPIQAQFDWQADAQNSAWQVRAQAATGAHTAEAQAQGRPAPPLRNVGQWTQADAWMPQSLQWRVPSFAALHTLWQPWSHRVAGRSEGRINHWDDPAQALVQAEFSDLHWQAQPDDKPWSLAHAEARWADGQGQLQWRQASADGWQLTQGRLQGGLQQPWQWDVLGRSPLTWAGQPVPAWRFEGQGPAPSRTPNRWGAEGWRTSLKPAVNSSSGPADSSDWLRWDGFGWQWQADGPVVALQGGNLMILGERFPNPMGQYDPRAAGAGHRLQLSGQVQAARWLARWQPEAGWRGDLLTELQLKWERGAGSLSVERLRGDLLLNDEALGLQTLSAQVQHAAGGATQAQLAFGSPVLGEAQVLARASPQGVLDGHLQSRLPALHLLQPWLPAGLQWRGSAAMEARLSGTRAQPRLKGQGRLALVRLQHAASGLGGQNGVVRWHFDENALVLDEARLQGLGEGDSGGRWTAQGQWTWGQAQPQARLQMQAEQFRLFNRFDRQLTVSGDASAQLDARRVHLRGQLRADQGVFDISEGDGPSLDDDITVRRAARGHGASKAATSPWQRDIVLQLDLGQRLRVQGRGLASRLTGQLQVQEQEGRPAQWTGQIEMGGGRYKAYGQTLDIESGELRFTGALENPRLDILALRPDVEVRVGVRATGSAQSPRIRLYSEPDMPDNDKLAWLLLGRAPDELGRNDTALLQRAALALVSGEGNNPATQLLDKLGLTEFSVSNSDDAGTTLRLGAQLSRRWSVGYERSLNTATGSWQLVYRLGQRFRLRAQSGTNSAVDALWLWRFD